MKADILVFYKPEFDHPENAAAQNLLKSAYSGCISATTGKYFSVELSDCLCQQDAANMVKGICNKLLTNPIFENYSFKILHPAGILTGSNADSR